MSELVFAISCYRAVRDRIRAEEVDIDDVTLADTVEGLTDLHEILAAIIRGALVDEALAAGLKVRISEMQGRLSRLEERARKRRQIARDTMLQTDIRKINTADFSTSLRSGTPSLAVIDEKLIPDFYWERQAPRLKRQELVAQLKRGGAIPGVELSNPEPVLSVRTR